MKYVKNQKIPTKLMLGAGLLTAATGAGVWLLPNGQASAACNSPATSYGNATYAVSVANAGDYRIWSRVMAPDTTNNSYLLEIDGTCFTVGDSALQANKWTWVDYQSATSASKITAKLSAGQHTVKVIGREASVKIDRILAVTDTACTPVDTGDNCAVAGDSVTPTVAITAPADGVSVSGAVAVTANATDDKGVVKAELYVNNVLQTSRTAAPYSFSWNTATLANGSYTITVKAYDAAGNVGTDANTVVVKNGDTQAPTVPATVIAVANSSNNVTVTWKASTDNTGVIGYTVTRNGVAVGTAVTGTTFTDSTALPGTQYSYKVAAYDAAGNTSAYSSAASVTTPVPTVPDTQAPTVPTNVAAATVNASQVNLTWKASTDNTGVAGYDVYRSPIGGAAAKVATVTSTQFGDTGLNAATSYSYYIIAKDTSGNSSPQSSTVNVTTSEATLPPTQQQNSGVIRGKVTGSDKKAIANVKVTARLGSKTYNATSNASGVYRLENLPAGRYDVHYEVKGYKDADQRIRVATKEDVVFNMRLVSNNSRSSWWNRWWR